MCRPATAQQVRGDYSAGGARGHKRPVKTDLGGAAVSCLTCCSFISPRVSALVRRKSRPGGPADPGPLRPPRTQPDPSAAGPQRGGADGHMPGCCWLCHGSSHGDPASPADVWVRERARSGNWSEPALGRMTSARHTCFPLPLAHPSHLPADATGQAPAAFPALLPVCVSSGHHHKGPQPGSLNSLILCLQAWRLESQTRVWAALVLLRPPSWACRRPSPPRVLTGSSLCVSVS